MKKKSKKKISKDKQNPLIDILRKHGTQIYDDLDEGNFPKFSIPSRSVSNIVYDKKLRQYIIHLRLLKSTLKINQSLII